ncbi:MAG: hypothetical protein IPI58_03345 [Alphaproteobacteria bacterium]|nr:MAG: hypothetical protein IPI58_03345 [Alphaproteobacteria bacterium]
MKRMLTFALAALAVSGAVGLLPHPAAADTRVVVSYADRNDHNYRGRDYRHAAPSRWDRRHPHWDNYGPGPVWEYRRSGIILEPRPLIRERVVVVQRQPTIIYQNTVPVMSAEPVSGVYIDNHGLTCREFQSSISVSGRYQPAYGTACLQPDGSWRVTQ